MVTYPGLTTTKQAPYCREKVSEDKPVSIYSHDKSYLVTVEQGERHYQLHKSKKLQDAKLSAEQLKGKLKDLLHLVRKCLSAMQSCIL